VNLTAPPISRVLETALYCDDLPGTAAFYRDVMGFGEHFHDDRLVALDSGGSTILLLFARGASRHGVSIPGGTIPPHNGSGPAHIAFAIDTNALDEWEARLTAASLTIESRVHWARGGRSIYFRDPEGHSVELATPGVWPTY